MQTPAGGGRQRRGGGPRPRQAAWDSARATSEIRPALCRNVTTVVNARSEFESSCCQVLVLVLRALTFSPQVARARSLQLVTLAVAPTAKGAAARELQSAALARGATVAAASAQTSQTWAHLPCASGGLRGWGLGVWPRAISRARSPEGLWIPRVAVRRVRSGLLSCSRSLAAGARVVCGE